DVADAGVAPPRAAEHLDAHAFLGAGVVRDVEVGVLLDHGFTGFSRGAAAGLVPRPPGPRLNGPHLGGAGASAGEGTSAGGAGAPVGALVTPGTSRQRFSLESGRLSMISTVSPTCDSLFSSWAWQTVRRLMYLVYRGCFTSRGISTRRVLFILSLVTTPTSTRRRPRSFCCVFSAIAVTPPAPRPVPVVSRR